MNLGEMEIFLEAWVKCIEKSPRKGVGLSADPFARRFQSLHYSFIFQHPMSLWDYLVSDQNLVKSFPQTPAIMVVNICSSFVLDMFV